MADNVELNAATGGATILTDDCTTGHAQIIKLAISTDGSAVLIPAEATNGLDVDVTRVIPGTAATTLGKAEDGAHSTGDVGVMALAVRSNTAASTSGADGDYQPLITDTNGKLWVNAGGVTLTVDGSGVTQPVSGTVAVTNAGLTELAAAINASAQMDVNVAAGTLAVTNAGTFAVQAVATNAGTFAVQATVAAGATNIAKAEDAAHASGDVGVPALAVRQDTAASLAGTDADYQPLITDANGKLWVNAGGVTLTVASHAVTNAGTFATQVDGAALTALQLIDNPVLVDDAAFTPATSSVMMAGFQADEGSTDSVDEGDAGAARMTLDRKQIVTAQGHAAGGLTIFRSIDLDETEEEVKASAGTVYGCWVTNTATTTRWLKFYNATAANVTVGSTTPVITIGIPGNATDDIAGNFGPGGVGIGFGTAITVAVTTGVADADTGAPGANDVIVNIFYA